MENIFGKNLLTIRKELKLTQDNFAKPLGIKGSFISDIERGKAKPSESVIQLLEIKYRLNREWLFSGQGDPYIKVHDGEKDAESDVSIYKVGDPLDEDPEIAELLIMTREIIKSGTGYTHSLAANIRSFYQAMQNEQCLGTIKNTMNQLASDVEDIKQQIKQRNQIRDDDDQAQRGEILKKRKA